LEKASKEKIELEKQIEVDLKASNEVKSLKG